MRVYTVSLIRQTEHMYVNIYVCEYVYACEHICASIHICVYVYIYSHTHRQARRRQTDRQTDKISSLWQTKFLCCIPCYKELVILNYTIPIPWHITVIFFQSCKHTKQISINKIHTSQNPLHLCIESSTS